MKYSPKTMSYLLQRFASLKENPTFEAAYKRMCAFADSEEVINRDELIQYSHDLRTMSEVIDSLVSNCDDVEKEMVEQQYLEMLPPHVKLLMEDAVKKINEGLLRKFQYQPVTRRNIEEMKHVIEVELQFMEIRHSFTTEDVEFLRKRVFDNLTLNNVPFRELEANPNHPLFGGRY